MPVEIPLPNGSRRAERAADAAVHGVGIAAAVIGVVALVAIAAARRSGVELATVAAYSAGLLAMLVCSLVYNMAGRSRYREFLRRLDHAAIFVMIAGTYTPFTALVLSGGWAIGMTGFVWAVAAAGVALKLSVPSERFVGLSLAIYLLFGWIGMVVMWRHLDTVGVPILVLLVGGGIAYSLGTIVHALERLPFQRAIWHGFVVAAAALHYAAVVALVRG
jgi:hemolysin III